MWAITLAPKTTNMCPISMDFLEKFLTVVALEGFVAGGTANPTVPTSWQCICLAVQWFGGMNGFKDNQHVFGQSRLS